MKITFQHDWSREDSGEVCKDTDSHYDDKDKLVKKVKSMVTFQKRLM